MTSERQKIGLRARNECKRAVKLTKVNQTKVYES